MLLSNTDISSCGEQQQVEQSEHSLISLNPEKTCFSYLVIGFGEVIQAGDVFQEQSKLCWEVLEHQAVLISLLQFPHVLLGTHTHTRLSHSITACPSWDRVVTHFVLDLPPRQLTHQKLHQHVEEGPQVVVATHLLQNDTNAEFPASTNPNDGGGTLTLFLWALTDA